MKWNDRIQQRWGVLHSPEVVTNWERQFAQAVGGRFVSPDEMFNAVECLTKLGTPPSLDKICAELCRIAQPKRQSDNQPYGQAEPIKGCESCRATPGWITWRPQIDNESDLTVAGKQAAYAVSIPCDCAAGQKFGFKTINSGWFSCQLPGVGYIRQNWQDALRLAKWQQGREIDIDAIVSQSSGQSAGGVGVDMGGAVASIAGHWDGGIE